MGRKVESAMYIYFVKRRTLLNEHEYHYRYFYTSLRGAKEFVTKKNAKTRCVYKYKFTIEKYHTGEIL